MKPKSPMWKISIDTGGTFTDGLGLDPDGNMRRIKVLSSARLRGRLVRKIEPGKFAFESSWKYDGALLKGYAFQLIGSQEVVQLHSLDYNSGLLVLDRDIPFEAMSDFELYTGEEAPVLAARLLTETRLEDPFPMMEMRLGTTKGTNALLERKGAKTLLVVTKGFKDLLYIGTQQRPHLFQLDIPEPDLLYADVMEVDERLDKAGNVLLELLLPDCGSAGMAGYQSVAVSLLNAYQNDVHEQELLSYFRNHGVHYVSSGSQLFPFSHYLRRTQTAVVNAYLDPVLDVYLTNIRKSLGTGVLKIMTSTGSLSDLAAFRAKDSVLSGPAGGMVASMHIARSFGFDKVLTFDMGGTSTDVARIDGEPEMKYITEIDRIEFHNPALAIETVAAGGGSVCWFDGYTLQVGPESAGASPGPACYGAGGPLTITDVNLLLGKLDPSRFGIPVKKTAAVKALEELRAGIKHKTGNWLDPVEILTGLERIANEKMADAIRRISIEKGIDPADHALVTFGGAGGLHSCQLAELLEIDTVILPYDAGLFSAVGIGKALISTLVSRQILLPWEEVETQLPALQATLSFEAGAALSAQGVEEFEIAFLSVFLRFEGQENTLEIAYVGTETITEFNKRYTRQFGYYPENLRIELESVRIKAQERAVAEVDHEIFETGEPAQSLRVVEISYGNHDLETALYDWDLLSPGEAFHGPAVIISSTSTAYIPAGWELVMQRDKDALIFNRQGTAERVTFFGEEVALELFTNRFRAIAEEMGAQLQHTAFSVNVRERLDFSCALLDAHGDLLVNAQHIPVHLGSMGICGRLVREAIDIEPGDVVITNHPAYGGSHLPDITLLAGVFDVEGTCVGYVINRAHHAEVGGKSPGSMPPDATTLEEEGVVILPQYLVKRGVFQHEALRTLFTEARYPTRNYIANEADIAAALSALHKGSGQLLRLIEQHGAKTIQKYMRLLKQGTEDRLREALVPFSSKKLHAVEHLDDGHRIEVNISITADAQVFDFTGSSAVHPNNLNANISILHSAILYVLRLLVLKEIPLNEGLMKHVKIVLPPNSFLHPEFSDDPAKCPAVVGGNTEVSQRLVDTLLKAFGVAACSQGTMNNFLFGNSHFGYYETIGGGAGAGPGFHGRSAVHQHMTNTRITDPEQLERKYPVRLLEFGVRKGSGGAGAFKGGDGLIRKILFLDPLQVTLIAQHRHYAPYGLNGGNAGLPGKHTLISENEVAILPGIASVEVVGGDVLVIETPGAGGFGAAV